MTRRVAKLSPPSVPILRIRLLWKLLEVEGQGFLPVVGAIVICLIVVGWWILR
jgi:hypothetical protein